MTPLTSPATWSDNDLHRYILRQASISTTALALADTRMPAGLLISVLRLYLAYFRFLTGATKLEVYATVVQEAAIEQLGVFGRVTGYHVPWQKEVRNLTRLVSRSHPCGMTATVHAYEWADHFHIQRTGLPVDRSDDAMAMYVHRTEPASTELDLLDQAASNGLAILFETMVDREFYDLLPRLGKSRERYLFERVDYVRNLRDGWLARHGTSQSSPTLPVGIVFNPWHAAMEMRGPEIGQALRRGESVETLRNSLLPILTRFADAMEGLVLRFYAGNSRKWDMRLPEILQRGHFLDPKGVVPEWELLRRLLLRQPELANAVTLEASPQSALFSGRFLSEFP